MRKLSVNSNMSRPPKPVAQAKRVAPPAVPDVYRHSGSSFGSAGYGSSEDTGNYLLPPPDTPTGALTMKLAGDDHSDYGSVMSKSPGVLSNYHVPSVTTGPPTAFTFPATGSISATATVVSREPLTHKAAVYYHQQLALQEDQGIDLTQSPGRDSPGSSSGSAGSGSRHSTASLDSGRASSYHTQTSTSTRSGGAGSSSSSSNSGNNGGVGSNICSGGGSSSIGSGALSSPRCSSVSSCSIGSVDRMIQGTDYDMIIEWLRDLCFEEYAQLFAAAGYDMPTISRMTPEDLTAIGIKKPHHRERIKHHIDALQMPDNLPSSVPGSIEELLRLLRLDEYLQPLLVQGYETIRDLIKLPWEDMEDIGIVKLGHQKKLLLAIKRVKDIISGKWTPIPHGYTIVHNTQQITDPSQQSWLHSNLSKIPSDDYHHTFYNQSHLALLQQHYHQPGANLMQPHQTQHSSLWNQEQQQQQQQQSHGMSQSAVLETEPNNIVLIKLKQPRGKSLESLENPIEHQQHQKIMSGGSHLTFAGAAVKYYNNSHAGIVMSDDGGVDGNVGKTVLGQLTSYDDSPQIEMTWRRSYDDGDITPTNEIGMSSNSYCDQNNFGGNSAAGGSNGSGGGTLPRHNRSGVQRQRPIAKVMANVQSLPMQQQQPQQHIGSALILGNDFDCDKLNSCPSKCYGVHCQQQSLLQQHRSLLPALPQTPTLVASSKKHPPPEPPKRHCAIIPISSAMDQLKGHFDGMSLNHSNYMQQEQQLHLQQHHHPHHQQQQQYLVHHMAVMQQQHLQQLTLLQNQPLYANYTHSGGNQIHQTTVVEIHAEKINDSKSNSSIDSIDAIPFANDNAGTIKQRALNRQDIQSSSLSSSSSSSSLATTVANVGQSSLTLKSGTGGGGGGGCSSTSTNSNCSSSSCSSNGSSGGGSTAAGSGSSNNNTKIIANCASAGVVITTIGAASNCSVTQSPSQTPTPPPSLSQSSMQLHQHSTSTDQLQSTIASSIGGGNCGDGDGNSNNCNSSGNNSDNTTEHQSTIDSNVLNDIGNMLANLTDELDAMLEEEKRAGLNDSE